MSSPPKFFPFDDDYRNVNDWEGDEKCPCCKLQYSVHSPGEAVDCARKIIRQAVKQKFFEVFP